MAPKLIYETTLLVCSSCVIFTGTVSAVLLMLIWPQDRILGLSTRLVIGLCVIIVAIFSVGFVGTIAESTQALIIYACLLILFPVSVLLVEIILRLSSLSPNTGPTITTTNPTSSSSSSSSSSSTASSSPTSTSTSSSSILTIQSSTNSSSSSTKNFQYKNKHQIPVPPSLSSTTSLPMNALIFPTQSVLPSYNEITLVKGKSKFQQQKSQSYNSGGYNLSNQTMLLLSDPKFMSPSSSLPTNDGSSIHVDDDDDKQQNMAKHLSSITNITSIIKRPSPSNSDIEMLNNKEYSIKNEMDQKKINKHNNDGVGGGGGGKNLLSKIFTASLSPKVETSIEYILIGMLGFVLVQIVISYLLAYEIRTIQSELKMINSSNHRRRRRRFNHDDCHVDDDDDNHDSDFEKND
nr:uncharacterized serine-rich protein C215.13-like [Dermatophagoides farinae]